VTLFLQRTVFPVLSVATYFNFTTENIYLVCSEHFSLGLVYMIYRCRTNLYGPKQVGVAIRGSEWSGGACSEPTGRDVVAATAQWNSWEFHSNFGLVTEDSEVFPGFLQYLHQIPR
jgi:hypothetical protein